MEKTLKPILLLFLFLIVSTGMKAQSEITEEALQKADSLLIEKYKRDSCVHNVCRTSILSGRTLCVP